MRPFPVKLKSDVLPVFFQSIFFASSQKSARFRVVH
jgi:hypothetical protein